jgi:sulfate transport system ATP-binding protein
VLDPFLGHRVEIRRVGVSLLAAHEIGEAHGISVCSLTRTYGTQVVLDRVELDIRPGELVALLEPSGSGKTTLLRLIAGLDAASGESIQVDGEDAARLTIQEHRVGFFFRSYPPFRHMTVFDNVACGLTVRPRKLRPSRG